MAINERGSIDPRLHERRERIATAVLAELVGRAGEYRPEHAESALRAADELMKAIDTEGL